MESLNQIYSANNPTDVPDFRPAYVAAVKRWLVLSGIAIISIWLEAKLTNTLSQYLSVAFYFFAPGFLGVAAYIQVMPSRAERGAAAGFLVMSGYFTLAYVFALVYGPWTYSYLIFSNAIWASVLYLYASLFLGKWAFQVSLANAIVITLLTLGCLYRFTHIPPDWQGDKNYVIQPYIYSILSQWAMFFGARVVNQLYKAMHDAQRKVATLRGVMTEMVGHEIGTPLQAIFNNIELLQLLQGRLPVTPGGQESLAKSTLVIGSLLRSVEQVQSVLDNAAAAMRPSGGGIKVVPSVDDVNLVYLLGEIIEDFAPRAAERNLSLRLDRSQPMPAHVRLDKTRVTQIVSNLISNAIKYSDHGEIVLTASSLRHGECQFSVRDTGIGIPQDALNDIFEPYLRLPEALSRGAKGSGLGLAVVKRELEVLGGGIQVESVHGQGSEFTFHLPAEVLSFAPRAGIPARALKVLVVDDSEIVLGVAQQIFEGTDIQCRTAADGGKALDILANEQVDIVFLDIQMPVADGLEVARRIRIDHGLFRNRNLPIIAMSANVPLASQSDAQFFNHFLKKPFTINQALVDRFLTSS